MIPCCKNCKTGDMLLDTYHARKSKQISRKEALLTMKATGQKCFCCMYNGITGMKARAYRKASANFQALDYFEPKEVVNE